MSYHAQRQPLLAPVTDTPPITGQVGARYKPHAIFTPFVGFCFTVNYILGSGILSVPKAFAETGWGLGVLVLVLVTAFSTVSSQYIVETMARAQGHQMAQQVAVYDAVGSIKPLNEVTLRKFEFNELCGKFLGIRGRRLYEICVTIYMFGCLWSYGSVFASSMANIIPVPAISDKCDIYTDQSAGCFGLYRFYLGMFALFVVPVSCLELTEQKYMQVALAVFRLAAVAVMIVTTMVLMYEEPYTPLTAHAAAPEEITAAPYTVGLPFANINGLSIFLPIAVYTQVMHHSIPALSQPVEPKSALRYMFAVTMLTTFCTYTVLAVLLSVYYGSNIATQCTLTWINYTAGYKTAPWWAVILKYTVILFPPIDVLSAYVLNAITMANCLFVATVQDPVKRERRSYSIPFRVGCAALPLVGAMLVYDLQAIISYTGLMGIFISMTFPAALQYYSKKTMTAAFGADTEVTSYSNVFSSNAVVAMLGVFSVLVSVSCFIINVLDQAGIIDQNPLAPPAPIVNLTRTL